MGNVIEKLKQGIVAIRVKVRRYQEGVHRFQQNRMFQNDQRWFYREFNCKGQKCDDDDDNQPDAEESKKCWGNLWNEWVDHNRDAKWLKELQSEINVTKQVKVYIAKESLKEILGRMPNWKSPGPVLVWGILVKTFYQFPW